MLTLPRVFGPLAGPVPASYLDDNFNALARTVVLTIAELRTLLKTSAGEAFVTGYYASGDGGGGQYYYNASDTTSADNGGTIIVAADGGRWYMIYYSSVSIKQFGAKMDNVTDDTNAVNAALGAVKNVTIPAGGLYTTRPINMTARGDTSNTGIYSGRSLTGAGSALTQINAYTGNYPCIDLTGSSNCVVQGINFRSDNPAAFGLAASACASIGLFNCRGSASSFNTSCSLNRFQDLRLNMTSDATRNSGNGTFGIMNVGGEHLIGDLVQIYANTPLVIHNVAQCAVSYSANIPTFGSQYEVAYSGSAISCTIMDWRDMQLISYDSFRAGWFWQVANVLFVNLYTSTRKLILSAPANLESFYLDGSCANVRIVDCYQEASGEFSGVFLMDHRYLTLGGLNENIDFTIQRAVADKGFTNPGTAQPSFVMLANASFTNSRLNCNYTDGNYVSSGDNNGFAALPVTTTGAVALHNVEFVLDHGAGGVSAHSAAIFSAIGQYCMNVLSKNYRSGDSRRNDNAANGLNSGVWTPVIIGLTTAGVGTYTFEYGTFERSNGWCFISARLSWSAHTGTGGMALTGLPFTSDANAEQALSVSYDGLTVGAGKQMTATIPNNQTRAVFNQADPSGGALLGVQVDSVVTGLTITGCYKIAD